MRVVSEVITPSRASEILAHSESQPQRVLADDRVGRFAHDIKAGQWMVTHQPIALDEDGVLIDGQHRLRAVIRADVPVEMSIAYDVERDTFKVIDTGAARNPGATLKLAGYSDTNVLAAAVRMYLSYRQLIGTKVDISSWSRANLSVADILEYLETDEAETLPQTVNRASVISNAIGRYGTRSFFAAALHAIRMSGASPEVIAEFTEKVSYGSMLPVNSPILTFRRWLISETGFSSISNHHRSQTGFMATIRVFNGWMQGDDLQLIRVRATKDVIVAPVPRRLDEIEFKAHLAQGVEAEKPERQTADMLELELV